MKERVLVKSFFYFILVSIIFLLLVTPGFSQENEERNLNTDDIFTVMNSIKEFFYSPPADHMMLKSFLSGVEGYYKEKKKVNPFSRIDCENIPHSIEEIKNTISTNNIGEKECQEIFYAGFTSMLQSLGDDGCKYYPPGKYRKSLKEMGYNKGGGGFYVDKEPDSEGRFIIIGTLQEFPADKEGVQAGDRIIKVDGQSIKGMTFYNLADIVRGPVGTSVVITIYRPDAHKEMDIAIERTWLSPNPKSLKYEVLNDNIGYIKFKFLGERMDFDLDKIYQEFKEKGVQSIIWDMRNSAGSTDGAIQLLTKYIEKDKLFVSRVYNDDREVENYRGEDGKNAEFPMVILINKYTDVSCSLSAQVMNREKGVKLIGMPMEWETDLVRSHYLPDNSAFTLVDGFYRLGDGTVLKNKDLVKPTIEIEQPPVPPLGEKGDLQLQKAIEVLKQK